jgi:hypothetical protein
VVLLRKMPKDLYRKRAWPSIDGSGDGPDCPLLPEGTQLVDDTASCRRATRAISRCHTIALDCEGILQGGDTPLGLLQIWADGTSYVFDMLAPESASFMTRAGGLGKVLKSRSIVKVIHDSRGDVAALASKYGCGLEGVADTQIAYCVSKGLSDGPFAASLNQVLSACGLATNDDKDAVSRQVLAYNRLMVGLGQEQRERVIILTAARVDKETQRRGQWS